MKLFTREEYKGLVLEYWYPERSEESTSWNIIAYNKDMEFKGEWKFNTMDINSGYIATFPEIIKSGKDLANKILKD